jgi:uncharacterized membrane protein YphA (DoxX/SURF4 family)
MHVSMNWLNRYADPVYCVVRILIALMFACHGTTKILGFPPSEYGPATNVLGLVAGWIEFVGGFLIAFGFLTRLAAFICSGEMAVAYFLTAFFPAKTTPRAVASDHKSWRIPGDALFYLFLYGLLRIRTLECRFLIEKTMRSN